MSRIAPRRRSATALAALSVLALGTAAAPASAGSLEQVTRASGSQGWSPLIVNETTARFTSDSGRFAIFRSIPLGYTFPGDTYYVRDIVANTTKSLGATVEDFYGVDKAEQNALVKRFDKATGKTTLALQPLSGGAAKVLYTWPRGLNVTAALSGDGKTVAVSSDVDPLVPGLFKITVATGAVQQIDTARVSLGPNSISDDGQVIAGRAQTSQQGVYYRGTTKTTTPARTVVSPNGAVVAAVTYQDGFKLLVKTLSTGVVKTFALPEGVNDVLWISTDGRTFATPATVETPTPTPTKVLNTTTGAWTNLAGPYADATSGAILGINSDEGGQRPAVSRSGRFAQISLATRTPYQLGLADLTGGDLPGDQEALAPSAYVDVSRPIVFCNEDNLQGVMSVLFNQSHSWLPRPKSATVRITADGTEVLNDTLTDAGTPGEWVGDQRVVTYPGTAKTIAISVKVVDAENRTVTTTESVQSLDLCAQS